MSKTVRWTYTGCVFRREENNKGSLFHVYIDDDGEDHWFSRPMGASKRSKDIIGGVYEGEADDKSAYNTGNWKYVGKHDEEQEIVAWSTRDTVAISEDKRVKEFKEEKRRDPIYECLDPIREVYKRTNGPGRRAIITKILEYLTR